MAETLDNLLKAEGLDGAGGDPFATRVGPTPDCFSANDVVRMFRLGALHRDMDHLRACGFCLERVEAFSKVVGKQLATTPNRSWLEGWRERFSSTPMPTLVGAHVLVHIPSAYSIAGAAVVEPVRVQLVAGHIRNLRNVKVRLVGALTAEIPDWSSGNEQFPIVEMRNVKPSGDVLQALKRHNRVTKQVVIEVGESLDRPHFMATADVEFTRAI